MRKASGLMAPWASLLLMLSPAEALACTFEGEPQSLGVGTVRTYVTLDEEGKATELGIILSEGALANLPEAKTEYVLPLPVQAATTAITHIGLNWQVHGHIPPGIYSSPHFDIHAYVLTPVEREAITATGSDLERVYEMPAPEFIPTNYVMAPDSAEPFQGSHWVNPTLDEFQGAPHGFDHTLIYGFYGGEMAFVEPMVTLEFLQSRQRFEGAIAQPERYTRPGRYPTGYRIDYNGATGEHIISLTGFVSPEPSSP